MPPKKHLVALEIDGSSGAVDGKNDVHDGAFSPMSSITDCMAWTVAIASMDVTLQVLGLQVDEQDAPGAPSTQPVAVVEVEEVVVDVRIVVVAVDVVVDAVDDVLVEEAEEELGSIINVVVVVVEDLGVDVGPVGREVGHPPGLQPTYVCVFVK